MPSLLIKVQDAQKFLAHYPSFFSYMFEKQIVFRFLLALFILSPTLAMADEIGNDNPKSTQKPQEKTNKFHHLNKTAMPLDKNRNVTPEEQKKILEKKLYDAAKLYEKQFLNEMVKAMRSTITHSEYSQPTMAERIYQDKVYDEYVQNWSDRGGVGFSETIYKQLLERYSPYHNRMINSHVGAIPFKKTTQPNPSIQEEESQKRVVLQKTQESQRGISFQSEDTDNYLELGEKDVE